MQINIGSGVADTISRFEGNHRSQNEAGLFPLWAPCGGARTLARPGAGRAARVLLRGLRGGGRHDRRGRLRALLRDALRSGTETAGPARPGRARRSPGAAAIRIFRGAERA